MLRAALARQLQLCMDDPHGARARELAALLDVAEIARLGTVAIDNARAQRCLARVSERHAAPRAAR